MSDEEAAQDAQDSSVRTTAIAPHSAFRRATSVATPLIIAAMSPIFGNMRTQALMARGIAMLAIVMSVPACSDGATRVAFDIEAGVAAFGRGQAAAATIRHLPEGSPDGCRGPYTLQLSARSSLVIWCKDAAGAQTVASHATTYHLRFVDVPQTFRIDKAAGEATLIDIVRRDGKPEVRALR